jgi:hypothetical protein
MEMMDRETLAVGFLALVILAGLTRSGARRHNAPPVSGSAPLIADQLQKLVQLHGAGDLSDDEFARAKRPLLG